MLFSATQTQKVEDIMKLAVNGVPIFVSVEDTRDYATNATLEQVHHPRYL
jgi:superfamily II DNA/RNA helicase